MEKHWIKIPVVLYVMGFIVHNVYLSNYGSYEFQLVQAKYILSGFGLLGFSVVCFVYMGIKVNLSNISRSLAIDNLLPWALRIISLPYFVYSLLYGKELFEISQSQRDALFLIGFIASTIGNAVVVFSIFNITFFAGREESWVSKCIGFLSRIIALPMIIVSLVIAWNIPEFSGVMQATTYFFFGYMGIALRQDDEHLGIEPSYSDPETKESHENLYQFVFGVVAIFFLLWMVINNYTKYIYPRIPVALGGAKLEYVSIKAQEKTFDSYLIQETEEWVIYIDEASGRVEKIKTGLIDKIIFKDKVPNKSIKPTPGGAVH